MSNDGKKTDGDPFSLDPAPRLEVNAPFTEDDAETTASEISSCMSAVLAAAIDTSRKPGLALTAMQLGLHALRAAIIKQGQLSAEEAHAAIAFADRSFLADSKGTSVAVAAAEIDRRALMARPSGEDVENTVRDATACLEDLQRRGSTHPITQLVVLHTTRQIVTALLKHHHPDEHEEMLSIARAMENAMKPRTVEVIEIPRKTTMSKGGSA